MYNTEYRKSLRDAGFPGFRTLTFQQQPEPDTVDTGTSPNQGLDLNFKFYLRVIRIVMIADALAARTLEQSSKEARALTDHLFRRVLQLLLIALVGVLVIGLFLRLVGKRA